MTALKPVFRLRATQLLAVISLLWAVSGFSINYTNRNIVLSFVQDAGNNEMVVDLGSSSRFYNATPGTTFAINNYSGTSLSAAFSSLDNLKWSAFGSVAGTNGTVAKPKNSSWTTRARQDLATRSTPWAQRSSLALGGAVVKMEGVGNNAKTYADSFAGVPDPVSNSASTLILPAGNALAPSAQLSASGTFGGSWEDSVQNTTPADFVSGQKTVRSDLYELIPGQLATYLGYFEFKWDGTMTFTAAGTGGVAPASPLLTITRTVTPNVYSVSFTAEGNNAIYSLVATNSSGLSSSRTNWPVVAGPKTNAAVGALSFLVTNSVPNLFFQVRGAR